jgi:hypothetical protein
MRSSRRAQGYVQCSGLASFVALVVVVVGPVDCFDDLLRRGGGGSRRGKGGRGNRRGRQGIGDG